MLPVGHGMKHAASRKTRVVPKIYYFPMEMGTNNTLQSFCPSECYCLVCYMRGDLLSSLYQVVLGTD